MVEASRIGIGVEEHRIEAVGRARSAAGADPGDGAEDDPGVGLLPRLRVERDVLDLVEAPVPVEPGLRPGVLPDLDALLRPGAPVLAVGYHGNRLPPVP